MNKIILAAAMIVATIASVAPASASLEIVHGSWTFPSHKGAIGSAAGERLETAM